MNFLLPDELSHSSLISLKFLSNESGIFGHGGISSLSGGGGGGGGGGGFTIL